VNSAFTSNGSGEAVAQPVGRIEHTHIGGQAVLEGIMMRGKFNWAIAVRQPDGEIHLEEHDVKTAVSERPWLGKPVIRGVVAFYETIVLAMQAFAISAEYAGMGEGEDEKLSSREISISMILGLVLAIGLFIVTPALITNWVIGPAIERPFAWNLFDGILRVLAFFGYIWAISRVKDIQRVFAYHGAEHKTIHAYEHGLPLETAVIQRYETLHVRCGTSFLLMVMIIALFVYSLVPMKAILSAVGLEARWAVTLLAILIRILFLPLIAGLAYEVIKWAGRMPENPVVKVVLWPGLQLQRMTTRPPDDDMVEIAVAAMGPIIAREALEKRRRGAEDLSGVEAVAIESPQHTADDAAEDTSEEPAAATGELLDAL